MRIGILTAALLIGSMPLAPHDGVQASTKTCLDGGAPQGASFHRTLTTTTRKRDAPTVVSGSFIGEFSVGMPSCPGVDYVLHVISDDGTSLDVRAVAPSPQTGHAAISPDGSAVAISYPGDAASQTFLTHVTTGPAYINPCISSYVTIEIAGDVMTRSLTVLDCDNGSAGEEIYFVS